MKDAVLSMLGLARKAKKVVSGEFSTEKAVKEQKAVLVFVAEDASDGTKKKFLDMCSFYSCAIVFYGTKESLGRAVGKEYRASLAICDAKFAETIKRKMDIAVTME